MPTNYGNGGVFDYGNVLRNVSQIQNRNALTRNELDPNSLQNQLYAAKIRDLNAPAGSDLRMAPISSKEHTVDSIAEALRTGDVSALERYSRPDKPYKIDTETATEFWGIDRVTRNPVLIKSIPKNIREAASEREAGKQETQAGLTEGVPSTADIKADEVAATQQAGYEVDFKWKGLINAKVKEAETLGKARGEALTDLRRMEAALPGLQASAKQLKKLNVAATHTMLGKGWNALVRESGFGATKGATARAQVMSIIDNQVLPLLRITFGAAFTEAEGNRLRATMGNMDLSAEERNAQLDAFIAQKEKDVRAQEGLVDSLGADTSGNPLPPSNEGASGQTLNFDAQGNLIE